MSITLPNRRILLALACCASLALAPGVAAARAGLSFGGHPASVGSRGWRGYQNNGAQPPSPTAQGGYGAGYGYGSGSLLQRHPFLGGLAGGLAGGWLFGRGGFGGGMLRLLLLAGAIWFIFRLLRARAGRSGSGGGSGLTAPRSVGAAAVPFPRGRDVNVSDADLSAFQAIHAQVQEAWGAADLAGLRRLATPEMCRWFAAELSRNASRGVRNVVSDLRFLGGELTESWVESERQFATALLRWRALDYVVALGRTSGDADPVVGGDPRNAVETEEMWTFVRFRGGPWLLSAIQQV